MTDVFITGATGFLGRHVALGLLGRDDVESIYCLVRADDAAHGQERLLRSLARIVGAEEAARVATRCIAVPGDLTRDGLGLSSEDHARVTEHCSVFVHSAADVRFNQPLEEARARNVKGTQRVVALARAAHRLERFDWVGTAFVAGLRRDRVLESEIEHAAGWKNSYEQSKYEAEIWLREHGDDLPLTVFRPSVIVGESTTGRTSNFGMLYWPVQVYARGWWRTIVGRPDTPVDIVPVDFVAAAIVALSAPGQPVGETYHLAAGPEGSRTIAQIAATMQQYFSGRRPRYIDAAFFMRWVRPILDLFIWGKRGRVLKQGGRFFVPYFAGNPVFDVTVSHPRLAALGVDLPDVQDYMKTLLDYCVATDFGRRSLPEPTGAVDD